MKNFRIDETSYLMENLCDMNNMEVTIHDSGLVEISYYDEEKLLFTAKYGANGKPIYYQRPDGSEYIINRYSDGLIKYIKRWNGNEEYRDRKGRPIHIIIRDEEVIKNAVSSGFIDRIHEEIHEYYKYNEENRSITVSCENYVNGDVVYDRNSDVSKLCGRWDD